MMKKQFLGLLFICITGMSYAQINEVGILIGGSNYIGDIGRNNYIYPNKVAGGLIYKWNFNPRVAFRGTISHIPIAGNDLDSSNEIRKNREVAFSNAINELAVGVEYNFFEYDLSSEDKIATPYILLELVGFNYKTVTAEPTPRNYEYGNKTSYAIPFGIGFKSKLVGKFAFAIETKFRYTFEDDLDYTTNRINSLNFGGTSKDWYVFTGISIVYTFGRPACYAELR